MKCAMVGLFLLVACESPEKKIGRLQVERISAEMAVGKWKEVADSAMGHTLPFDIPDSVLDSLGAAKRKLELVNRDYNKFMNGR